MKNNRNTLKHQVKKLKDELSNQYHAKANITSILHSFVKSVDQIIISLFQKHKLHINGPFCLIATGSYGRRELSLHSDIDFLLLHDNPLDPLALTQAERFIQDCWDAGLETGHQITTIMACAELAQKNVSVISSLLDMRLICGRRALLEALLYQIHPHHMWNSTDFFLAKQEEQHLRYKKYGETAYNLEPNIKNGAGGLRDIHIILQISKRHFGIKKLAEGIQCGFISLEEYEELNHCLHFLWRVRFALHTLSGKKEDRLLFDYQLKLAQFFNYTDCKDSLAIEKFMKQYFSVIKQSRALNEVLLQWFSEAIVYQQKQKITPLNEAFQLSNDYIEAKHNDVFVKNPQNLLNLFLWIAEHPNIKGVRANTVRLIRQYLYLMNDAITQTPQAQETFLNLFKTNTTPYPALKRMSRYGVLGGYLEAFAHVTGQMQYDLFHTYTVEQHTLFVIRNIGRFLDTNYAQTFPLCHQLITEIPLRHILYLAALFHDIAKGRGGDHSELGAVEAESFARRHAFSKEEQNLLSWLVRHHLLMSQTAQRQDIHDPETIHQFCSLLPHQTYLEHLYLLTVADICATNPSLWNAWKDSLLRELYFMAKAYFSQLQNPLDEQELIANKQQNTLKLLEQEPINIKDLQCLWANFKSKYFLHHPPPTISQHTKAILSCQRFPLVSVRPHYNDGGTEVFIYMPHRSDRFSITTTVLNNQRVTIQEAFISTCHNNYDLDVYIILDEKNQGLIDAIQAQTIETSLMHYLAHSNQTPKLTRRRLSRRQAHFNLAPKIHFNKTKANQTRLFIISADRPGLLARISDVFLQQQILLHNAKITTAGEKVEDVFYITTHLGRALNAEQQNRLKSSLVQILA